jgi:hypothetical protein
MCLEKASLRSPTKEEITKVKQGFKVFVKDIVPNKNLLKLGRPVYRSVWHHDNWKGESCPFEYKNKAFWNKTNEPGFHVFLTAKDANIYLHTECRDSEAEYVVCRVKVRGLMMFGFQDICTYTYEPFAEEKHEHLPCFTCAQLKIMEEIEIYL